MTRPALSSRNPSADVVTAARPSRRVAAPRGRTTTRTTTGREGREAAKAAKATKATKATRADPTGAVALAGPGVASDAGRDGAGAGPSGVTSVPRSCCCWPTSRCTATS